MSCTWAIDGKFFQNKVTLTVPWPSDADMVMTTELDAYRLRYATTGLEQELRRRGDISWACLQRNFVRYTVPSPDIEAQAAHLRYIDDTEMYNLMHGGEDASHGRTELTGDKMCALAPPTESFLLLLPATIRGHRFHNKKWKERKELIRALMSVHIGKKNTIWTDFMEGKGATWRPRNKQDSHRRERGRVRPTTTVSSYMRRYWYCPENVEKYLESVLFIGGAWSCVVLLNGADVFLEERDMQRNALISVFLRVLEYYHGIVILTTNRIGTFDETFDFRVQLTLQS
ncbi:hypothetical protein BDU57DRAFT_535360 [Ampelomyces quisqualis]|uniref:ATPase AAA-type core domain-containing protein n=1 Tax=Ampelomyces quisqualis TaxID=50730 RepID=A0A6A5R3J7_AMPQU|nr:hypothetical protein BDU57DRAFT_535360 [Ampelomyces quisqualis]